MPPLGGFSPCIGMPALCLATPHRLDPDQRFRCAGRASPFSSTRFPRELPKTLRGRCQDDELVIDTDPSEYARMSRISYRRHRFPPVVIQHCGE